MLRTPLSATLYIQKYTTRRLEKANYIEKMITDFCRRFRAQNHTECNLCRFLFVTKRHSKTVKKNVFIMITERSVEIKEQGTGHIKAYK